MLHCYQRTHGRTEGRALQGREPGALAKNEGSSSIPVQNNSNSPNENKSDLIQALYTHSRSNPRSVLNALLFSSDLDLDLLVIKEKTLI